MIWGSPDCIAITLARAKSFNTCHRDRRRPVRESITRVSPRRPSHALPQPVRRTAPVRQSPGYEPGCFNLRSDRCSGTPRSLAASYRAPNRFLNAPQTPRRRGNNYKIFISLRFAWPCSAPGTRAAAHSPSGGLEEKTKINIKR